MTGYFVFKVLLEDTGDIVRLESVPYTSQSYYYDSTNEYYRERVVLNYDIINNERNDLYTVFRISEIGVGNTRKYVFADGSYMTFQRKTSTDYSFHFYAPNGSLYNGISNPWTDFTYTGKERKYLVLGGPISQIPYTTPSYDKPSIYSDSMPDAGIGTYVYTDTVLTGTNTYESKITSTKGYREPITYGNALIGNLITNAPYKDPSFWGETSKEQGGKGSFGYTTDEISIPNLPGVSALSTGFLTMYKMSLSSINTLAGYLWNDDFLTNLKKYFVSPSEAIISLSLAPFELTNINPNASRVFVGNAATPASGNQIVNQYTQLDFGIVDFKEYWGNYIDYELTDVSIYLPYCGTYKLDTKDVMKSKMNLVYNVDLLSGECVALIKLEKEYGLKSVIYQYSGNILSRIPYSASDMSSYVNTVLSTVSTGISGGLLGTGGAIASVAVSSAFGAKKESVIKGGSASGGKGFLSPQRPYLIITRPDQSLPDKFNSFVGYPSNITKKLSECSGYTEVDNIHLENIPATEAEISEIESLLKSGVLIN